MKYQTTLLTVYICLVGALLGSNVLADEGWSVTMAMIEPFSEPEIGYEIRYEALESIAVNTEGKPIKGPIEQYVMGIKKPVKAQKVQIRYQIDEPIIFELLSELATE